MGEGLAHGVRVGEEEPALEAEDDDARLGLVLGMALHVAELLRRPRTRPSTATCGREAR